MACDLSDDAYDWYNDSENTKEYFIAFAKSRNVDLLDDGGKTLRDDWADIVMALYDEARSAMGVHK